MPTSNSILTFPSAAKFDKKYLDYIYEKGTIEIDEEFINHFELWNLSSSAQRNKLQMLQFFGYVDCIDAKFVITENGMKLYESGYDISAFISTLMEAHMPYSSEVTFGLKNDYYFFKILFHIFSFFYENKMSINVCAFENLFCYLINDINCNNVIELISLLVKNENIALEEMVKARCTSDYLFSSLADLGILIKNNPGNYSISKTFYLAYQNIVCNVSINDSEEDNEDLSYNELIAKFKEMLSTINRKVVAIILFGIKYGRLIKKKKYVAKSIIHDVELDDSLYTELNKGIALSLYAKELNKYYDDFDVQDDEPKGCIIGYNKVFYGAPGCGKSWHVQNEIIPNELKITNNENIIRTTFYQDYSNTDFVGQVLPRIDGENVTYEFNPGPFTIALCKALKNNNEPIVLVIEELNRGQAASIFGDIFQLLDRSQDGSSVYEITNVNIQDYIQKELGLVFNTIKIPNNLFIVATMNTSDQNVFTLDTAFKRRWKFEKIKNEFNESAHGDWFVPGMVETTWKELVLTINEYIIANADELMNEDKQIGVYFIDENGLVEKKVDASNPEKIKEFSFKMLEYLWDDVAKFNRQDWFKDAKTLDQLLENYKNNNGNVFSKDLTDSLNEHKNKSVEMTEKEEIKDEE